MGVSSQGRDLEIQFSNPDLAGKTIKVILHDSSGNEKVVPIKLDGKGKGKEKILTPGWESVTLTHPSSVDHGIVTIP